METTGKTIQVLPEVGGASKARNEWRRQEYVLETYNQRPKKVCFQIFGVDKITQAAIQPGEELAASFNADSREYQDRWFTSTNTWEVDCPMTVAPQAAPMGVTPDNSAPASAPTAPISSVPDFRPTNPIDDLPF